MNEHTLALRRQLREKERNTNFIYPNNRILDPNKSDRSLRSNLRTIGDSRNSASILPSPRSRGQLLSRCCSIDRILELEWVLLPRKETVRFFRRGSDRDSRASLFAKLLFPVDFQPRSKRISPTRWPASERRDAGRRCTARESRLSIRTPSWLQQVSIRGKWMLR